MFAFAAVPCSAAIFGFGLAATNSKSFFDAHPTTGALRRSRALPPTSASSSLVQRVPVASVVTSSVASAAPARTSAPFFAFTV